MGNALQYILKLQDMLSPGMRAAASVTNTVSGEIASKFQQIGSSGKVMAASVNELKERLEEVNKVRFGTKMEGEFNLATKAAQKLESQIRDLEGHSKEGGLGGVLGGLAFGAGAFEIGKNALGLSAERESNQVNLGVMTGSANVGNKLLGDITAMADVTPFESRDLLQSGQMLLQFGMTADRVMPSLQQLGDISGGNAEKLQQLTLAFGKVTAEGKMSGRELEEMIYAGFNPLTVIAEKTGISMANLHKAMEHGAITTQMVQEAMNAATGAGGRFHDLMLKNSETLGGKWSTFMDLAHHRLRSFGDLLSPVAKGLMSFDSGLLGSVPGMIAVGTALVGFTIIMGSATFSTNMFTSAMKLMTMAIEENPLGVWLVAIGAAVALVIGLYKMFTEKQETVVEGFVKLANKENIATEIHGKAASAVSDNISKAKLLLGVINDENLAQGIRIQKLKELQSLDKEHFGSLTLATSATDAASKSLAAYTDEMWKHATAMAAVDKFKDIESKRLDAQMKIHDNLSTAIFTGTRRAGNGMAQYRYADQDGIRKREEQRQIALVNTAFDKSSSYLMGLIKGDKGAVSSLSGNGMGSPFDGLNDFKDSTGKDKADKINNGGQRSIVINVGKQIEKLEMHIVGGSKEVAEELHNAVADAMRRVLYSVNGAVTN